MNSSILVAGFLFIISAPSGAGKTSVLKHLIGNFSDLKQSISVTTRIPRKGEKNDIDYHFVSKEDFDKKVKNGEFLEHAEVFENSYGSLIKDVSGILNDKKNVLFTIDYQGVQQIKTNGKFDTVTVFIMPPSLEVLKERLIKRGDSMDSINFRLSKAAGEIENMKNYDYVVYNYDILETAKLIGAIYLAEKYKRINK